jgi:molybdenum cofactor biosynthesis protein B
VSEPPPSHRAHHHRRAAARAVPTGVITVSDTRTRESDAGGDCAAELFAGAGHPVALREIVKDDAEAIAASLRRALARHDLGAVVLTGGTGIAPRDVTPEAVTPLLERELPGFGELFRALSYQEIGSAALLSRALAGVAAGKLVFVLPGSPAGVRLALERLVLPELGHLAAEVAKGA